MNAPKPNPIITLCNITSGTESATLRINIPLAAKVMAMMVNGLLLNLRPKKPTAKDPITPIPEISPAEVAASIPLIPNDSR